MKTKLLSPISLVSSFKFGLEKMVGKNVHSKKNILRILYFTYTDNKIVVIPNYL